MPPLTNAQQAQAASSRQVAPRAVAVCSQALQPTLRVAAPAVQRPAFRLKVLPRLAACVEMEVWYVMACSCVLGRLPLGDSLVSPPSLGFCLCVTVTQSFGPCSLQDAVLRFENVAGRSAMVSVRV